MLQPGRRTEQGEEVTIKVGKGELGIVRFALYSSSPRQKKGALMGENIPATFFLDDHDKIERLIQLSFLIFSAIAEYPKSHRFKRLINRQIDLISKQLHEGMFLAQQSISGSRSTSQDAIGLRQCRFGVRTSDLIQV